jgi:hypothetical protein
MTIRALALTVALSGLAIVPALGQGIVVDEGGFQISIDGSPVGNETFVIRRAAAGREDQVFATGVVTLDTPDGRQEVRPLLSATPPDGVAASYQVRVTGPGSLEVRLNRDGRRYLARITSEIGSEDREFPARPDTRVLEQGVAHHYYVLRDLRVGDEVHVLEPRTRRELTLMTVGRTDVEIRIGGNVVDARRIELADGEDHRLVWLDRQGRVLRVEVPAERYAAERTDVVG